MRLKIFINLFICLNLIISTNIVLSKITLEEKLQDSINTHNVQKVKKILNDQNLNINSTFSNGKTPFYEALVNFEKNSNKVINQEAFKKLAGTSIITSVLTFILAGSTLMGYNEIKSFEKNPEAFISERQKNVDSNLKKEESKKIKDPLMIKALKDEKDLYEKLYKDLKDQSSDKRIINEFKAYQRKTLAATIVGSIIFVISSVGLTFESKKLKSNYDKSKEILDLIRNVPSCVPDEESIIFGQQKLMDYLKSLRIEKARPEFMKL